MSKSTSLERPKKKQKGLSHLSRFDAAGLVANTAIKVRDSGHQIVVRHARVGGEGGILIFIPGFELKDGNLKLIEQLPVSGIAKATS